MKPPTLWQFTASHYNEKARWALDWKRVAHVRRSLLPGPHALKIRKLTGQTAVPVLVLDGRAIHDSARIIDALEAAYPEPPLYPKEASQRERALALQRFFDEELGPHVRRWAFYHLLPHPGFVVSMFGQESGATARTAWRLGFPLLRAVMTRTMGIDAERAETSRRKTLAALDRIETELGPSGYFGDGFTVADLTAAALLSPLVAPPEFPYRLPQDVPAEMVAFRESIAARPAFLWVLEMYRRHRGRSAAVGAQ